MATKPPIYKYSEGYDCADLLASLGPACPFWGMHVSRTAGGMSPHCETSDIWVRYNEYGKRFDNDFHGPHDAVWYPASRVLPVKPLIFKLMRECEGERLGGILITKIPPGKSIKPHTDKGWHAGFYEKFAIQVQAHPKQAFHFDDVSLVTKPGDVFWFNNSYSHWVTNDSPIDRITMIVCIKRSN